MEPFEALEKKVEMNRMREHVAREMDVNKDGVVDIEEFLVFAESKSFKKNQQWKVS